MQLHALIIPISACSSTCSATNNVEAAVVTAQQAFKAPPTHLMGISQRRSNLAFALLQHLLCCLLVLWQLDCAITAGVSSVETYQVLVNNLLCFRVCSNKSRQLLQLACCLQEPRHAKQSNICA